MLYKRILLVPIVVFAFMNLGFSQQEVQDKKFDKMLQKLLSHNVNEIAPSDIDKVSEVLFLDARKLKEYDTSYIKNAMWVGYKDFDIERLSDVSKDKKIVVYCSVGFRSEKIAKKLEKAGYTDVSNLYGGIFEWVNQGNEVQNEQGLTADVHTFNKNWSKWLFKGTKIY